MSLMQTAFVYTVFGLLIVGLVILGMGIANAESCADALGQINAALDAGSVDDSLRANAAAMVQEAQRLLDAGQEAECMTMAERIKQSLGMSS